MAVRNKPDFAQQRAQREEQRQKNEAFSETLYRDTDTSILQAREGGPQAGDVELSIQWVPIKDVYPMGFGIKKLDFNQREQPRQSMDNDKLAALTADIAANGQQTPAMVRVIHERVNGNDYGLIRGHRRLEAAKRAGKELFLVRVISEVSDRAAYRLSLLDDAHNEQHSPLERGLSLARFQADLTDDLKEFFKDNNLDITQPMVFETFQKAEGFWTSKDTPVWIYRVAERASKTGRRPKVQMEDLTIMTGMIERSIRNYLKNANLSESIIEKLSEVKFSFRHLIALSGLETPELQEALFREIKRRNLTGEQAQERAKEMKAEHDAAPRPVVVPLRPLRSLVAQTRKLAAEKVPQDAPKEAREQGRAMVKELDALVSQLREKWG